MVIFVKNLQYTKIYIQYFEIYKKDLNKYIRYCIIYFKIYLKN